MFCVILMNLTDSTATLANPLTVSLMVDLNWRAGLLDKASSMYDSRLS